LELNVKSLDDFVDALLLLCRQARLIHIRAIEPNRILTIAELAIALRDVVEDRWILVATIRLFEQVKRLRVLA
jgi:hypothetical protein